MTETTKKQLPTFQIAHVDTEMRRKFVAYAKRKGLTSAELFEQLVKALPPIAE